ncbi:TPA: NAD-dependent epimerase/dehydratase family protein [Photobacterium damselae]
MNKYTVFGGRGFIGSEFVKELKNQGHDVFVPEREDPRIYEDDLGIVIYSAGYGDCQKDPLNVLNANVTLLSILLEKATFDKLVYISSTRVYMNQNDTFETSDLTISFNDNRKLFNLTKLVAEELCLKSNRNCVVIRPSNVYGLALDSNLFLPSIIRDAVKNRIINMYVDSHYSKDYVSVHDVVSVTLKILKSNNVGLYNIARGINTEAIDIIDTIKKYTNCDIKWHKNINSNEFFSEIDIRKTKLNIDHEYSNVLDDLESMIKLYKNTSNEII